MDFYNLVEIPQEEIYNTFLETFGDYKVNVKISLEQFLTLQKRSSYSPEFSLGCFENGKLVGFQMNGVRTIHSKLTCYGIAAGYIPGYRNKYKLSYRFLNYNFSTLKKLGIQNYLCEIMRDNLPAVKIVKKLGGVINRNILTYRKKINEIRIDDNDSHDFEFHTENDLSFLSLCAPIQDEASWQNSFDAINAILEDFFITTIRKDGNIIGYGVINKLQGDIPQFVIQEEFRDRGLGNLLLSKLINNTDSEYIGAFNVDENDAYLNKFFTGAGFEIYSKSYELIKENVS